MLSCLTQLCSMLNPEYEVWYNVQRMERTPTFVEQEAEGRAGGVSLSRTEGATRIVSENVPTGPKGGGKKTSGLENKSKQNMAKKRLLLEDDPTFLDLNNDVWNESDEDWDAFDDDDEDEAWDDEFEEDDEDE